MKRLPGRNDPCPCGSGRKFKKCHMSGFEMWRRLSSRPALDATEMKIAFCLAMEGRNLFRECDRQSQALQREYFGSYPDGTTLDLEGAETPLLSWRERLEVELRRLAATDSKYFWLFITQRLKPSKEKFGATELTVRLYRQVLKLAILKYGKLIGTPFTNLPNNYDPSEWVIRLDRTPLPQTEARPNTYSVPISISLEDIFSALLMEQLAYDFCMATALLRRIWKGGRLPVTDGLPDNVLHDHDTDWLIDLYDERLHYTRVLSQFGSIVSPEFARDMESKLLCLIPLYNLDGTIVPLVWPTAGRMQDEFATLFHGAQYRPNYLVVPANLTNYLKKVRRFRAALTETYGFPPEDVLCFLVALSYRQLSLWSERPQRHLQLWQRGYTVVVDEQTFIDGLAWFFSMVSPQFGLEISENEAREKVANLTTFLRYEPGDFDRIDLWTRSGLKLLVPTERGVLIDFSAIPDILAGLFEPLAKMRGEVGRLKGEDFEQEVASLLQNEVDDANILWRGKLLARSTPQEREVDIGVTKDDTLFIIECKAHALDPSFDKGEPAALDKRGGLNVHALQQADTLAHFLAESPNGKDWEVPPTVHFIASLAVSPFPEYIHERSDRFFLSERIPRVCTPEEAVEFMRQFRSADHVGKPWLFKVTQPGG